MKKQLIKNTILIISGSVIFTSCDKYLEKEPDNRASLETPEKVSQLLATAYPGANYVPFTETSTDNVGDIGFGDAGAADLNTSNADAFFFRDTRSISEDTPEYYWFACYKAIAACNQALETIGQATNQDAYRAQRGEALVARAYAHFMLVNIYAKFYDPATATSDIGIPYVTEPEKNFIKPYTRGTVAGVYDMIEKDLLDGIGYIDDKSYTIPKYHFNRAAANAFASRFYLYKGDFGKVIQYATAAVPASNFLINLRPWNTTYVSIGLNDIAPLYAKATENANLLLASTQSYWFRTNIGARYAMTPAISNLLLRTAPVSGGDWVYPTGSYVDNHPVVPKIDEYFKLASVNAEIGDGFVMVPLFTVEEVLFNLAEAYTYNNQLNDAITLLNTYLSTRIESYSATDNITVAKVNSYYGTSNTQLGLLNAILSFRRTEFVHEGMRWFDILRYKIPVTHVSAGGESTVLGPDDPRRQFQLPSSVTQSGIEQNPR